MTNILAIDTSSDFCSVALNRAGSIETRSSNKLRHHAQELLPMISELLDASSMTLSQLDGIAVVVGPGSFTGVRIGTGVAQGLAFGADIPLLGVSSLAAMAMRAYLDHGTSESWVALKARENEVYAGSYTVADAVVTLNGKEVVAAPQDVRFTQAEADKVAGIGSGWEYAQALCEQACVRSPERVLSEISCDAEAVAVIALAQLEKRGTLAPELVLPVYVKDELDYKA